MQGVCLDDMHAEGVMVYTRHASDDMQGIRLDNMHAEGVMIYTRCTSDDGAEAWDVLALRT